MKIRRTSTDISRKNRLHKEILTGEKFDAMAVEQRAGVFAEIESRTPRQRQALSRPMNAEERSWWNRAQKKLKAGRPRLGKNGTRIVSVTVEKNLLKQADAYAKANGLKRSELFARSVAEKIGNQI